MAQINLVDVRKEWLDSDRCKLVFTVAETDIGNLVCQEREDGWWHVVESNFDDVLMRGERGHSLQWLINVAIYQIEASLDPAF